MWQKGFKVHTDVPKTRLGKSPMWVGLCGGAGSMVWSNCVWLKTPWTTVTLNIFPRKQWSHDMFYSVCSWIITNQTSLCKFPYRKKNPVHTTPNRLSLTMLELWRTSTITSMADRLRSLLNVFVIIIHLSCIGKHLGAIFFFHGVTWRNVVTGSLDGTKRRSFFFIHTHNDSWEKSVMSF